MMRVCCYALLMGGLAGAGCQMAPRNPGGVVGDTSVSAAPDEVGSEDRNGSEVGAEAGQSKSGLYRRSRGGTGIDFGKFGVGLEGGAGAYDYLLGEDEWGEGFNEHYNLPLGTVVYFDQDCPAGFSPFLPLMGAFAVGGGPSPFLMGARGGSLSHTHTVDSAEATAFGNMCYSDAAIGSAQWHTHPLAEASSMPKQYHVLLPCFAQGRGYNSDAPLKLPDSSYAFLDPGTCPSPWANASQLKGSYIGGVEPEWLNLHREKYPQVYDAAVSAFPDGFPSMPPFSVDKLANKLAITESATHAHGWRTDGAPHVLHLKYPRQDRLCKNHFHSVPSEVMEPKAKILGACLNQSGSGQTVTPQFVLMVAGFTRCQDWLPGATEVPSMAGKMMRVHDPDQGEVMGATVGAPAHTHGGRTGSIQYPDNSGERECEHHPDCSQGAYVGDHAHTLSNPGPVLPPWFSVLFCRIPS